LKIECSDAKAPFSSVFLVVLKKRLIGREAVTTEYDIDNLVVGNETVSVAHAIEHHDRSMESFEFRCCENRLKRLKQFKQESIKWPTPPF